MCDALHYLLDNIFIRFGSKLYRQIVGIPMGTNCAPLVADLFLFCYERGSVVVDFLFIVTPIVGVCNCSMFCCTLLYVHSSIAIILMGKRELIALLNLSSWCLVMVKRLFLAVPRVCLQFVIVVFPDHTHLLFFMLCLPDNIQTDNIKAFNSTSRYLDDLLNIDNPYFEQMVGQIYPTELQLNKANSSDTEAWILDLNLSITNGIVSSKIYDKRDDFNFEIVNFPFIDGDVPCSPSYGVYISQLIRFARVCSNVDDFNNRNSFLTAKLLQQGYRYHKIRKAFSKFYHRHSELIVKYNIGLITLL